MTTLSVIVPVPAAVEDSQASLQQLQQVFSKKADTCEILPVVYSGTLDYAQLLLKGLESATGSYILTWNTRVTGIENCFEQLWNRRHEADVIIASRCVPGHSLTTHLRWPAFNRFVSGLLDIGVHDLTSSVRLYRRDVLHNLHFLGMDRSALIEILVHAYADGWKVIEVPLYCDDCRLQNCLEENTLSRGHLRVLWKLWNLRNSIQCADYDARAYKSRIFLQRAWQRSRYRTVTKFLPSHARVLDIGCGSSRILGALSPTSIGLDIQLNKLRFSQRYGVPLVNGDAFSLPFSTAAFDCVVCSQVIEHLFKSDWLFHEMARVLRPGGRLILGTPDYGTLWWPVIECLYGFFAPNAYADEHITHYNRLDLIQYLKQFGFMVETFAYVFKAELVVVFTLEKNLYPSV